MLRSCHPIARPPASAISYQVSVVIYKDLQDRGREVQLKNRAVIPETISEEMTANNFKNWLFMTISASISAFIAEFSTFLVTF